MLCGLYVTSHNIYTDVFTLSNVVHNLVRILPSTTVELIIKLIFSSYFRHPRKYLIDHLIPIFSHYWFLKSPIELIPYFRGSIGKPEVRGCTEIIDLQFWSLFKDVVKRNICHLCSKKKIGAECPFFILFFRIVHRLHNFYFSTMCYSFN